MSGDHQGCPLLMLLYIVVVKVLSIFTDVNTRIIKGAQTGGHETKIFFLKKQLTAPAECNRF